MMKQLFFFFILASILFSSCNNSSYTTTATALPTDTKVPTIIPATSTTPPTLVDMANIVHILPEEFIDNLSVRFHFISPDGEKIVLKFPIEEVNEEPSTTIPMVSTFDKEAIDNIEIPLDRAPTLYYFDSWAPDSAVFIGGFYNTNRFNGSELCCGEAVAITNLTGIEPETFLFSWEWIEGAQIAWSNNSSRFSLSFPYQNKILIVDTHGNLLKSLNQNGRVIFWTRNTINIISHGNHETKIYNLDLDTQKQDLLLERSEFLFYVAHNEELNQILLAKYNEEQDTNELFILNAKTKSIEAIETLPQKGIHLNRYSSSKGYVALKSVDNDLWIFNWITRNIEFYGQIKYLFGWYDNIDGFLVVTLNNEQKIIRP